MEALRIAAGDTKRMQNELKTNTTGTVAAVHILEGATVETGAALITVVAPAGLIKVSRSFRGNIRSNPALWCGDSG